MVSRRAWPELDDLFRPDCEVVIDTRRGDPIVVVGGAGVGAFVGPVIADFDFFLFTILNHRVWIDGADEARGRLYLCEERHDREGGVRSQAFGVYHDTYRRLDGRWWFARREYASLGRTLPAGTDRELQSFAFPAPWGERRA